MDYTKNICVKCGDEIPPLTQSQVICYKCLCKPLNGREKTR